MRADHVVENDLQRPGPGHAHHRLDEHCEQYDAQGAPVGAYETSD